MVVSPYGGCRENPTVGFEEEEAMNTWKKVLIGTLSAATLGGGTVAVAAAAGSSPAKPAAVREDRSTARQMGEDHGRENEVRGREAEPGDDNGREAEARGRQAEGEAPRGADSARDIAEAKAKQAGLDDNQGPSGNRGPSNHGRHGADDGPNHH